MLNRVLTGDGEGMTACDVIRDRLTQVSISSTVDYGCGDTKCGGVVFWRYVIRGSPRFCACSGQGEVVSGVYNMYLDSFSFAMSS